MLDDLTEIVLHEVGHTLGLRHNFRASTVFTQAQLDDPAFTAANGVAGSVMEYNAVNIAAKGKKQGAYNMTATRPLRLLGDRVRLQGDRPARATNSRRLARIAARNSEPLLAYATDEDAAFAIDPEASQADLGGDPLEFARRRFLLVKEMWDRWQVRELKPGENYLVYRRIVERGIVR